MSAHLLPGEPDILLTLRRSARARRISLRISQLDGRVTLTIPKRVSEAEALTFARDKEGWIRKHLAQQPETVLVGVGTSLPIEGQPHQIVAGPARRVALGDGVLSVPQDAPGARIQAYLKTLARDRLAAACDIYAARLGRPYGRLTLRDTRSRWGSCSTQGALMFSWRLILAPPEVLRYVAAHEVAHLEQMNHSPAFWETVTRIHGPYAPPRKWLRVQGNGLHRYRFGDG